MFLADGARLELAIPEGTSVFKTDEIAATPTIHYNFLSIIKPA